MKELFGLLAVTVLAMASARADIVDSRLYLPSPGDAMTPTGEECRTFAGWPSC